MTNEVCFKSRNLKMTSFLYHIFSYSFVVIGVLKSNEFASLALIQPKRFSSKIDRKLI